MESIVVSTVSCAEARHGNTDDALAREFQLVESFYANKQGQGRVKTTGDTNNYCLAISMYQSLGQAHHLDTEDFFASFVQGFTLGYEWKRIDGAGQNQIALVY